MKPKIKVLMVGPDRGVHGGISAVVNEFYQAELDRKVDLKYIGTMKEGSKLKKLFVAAFAFAKFNAGLKWCDIVHVHFSSDSSFVRKSFFIKRARAKGKKIVLHQHGGDFKNYYYNQLSDKKRANLRNVLDMGDVMLVLTSGWKDFFAKLTDPEKIIVFPNGINTSDGSDAGVDKDYNKILFLGRICKDKGMDELLEAMAQIHKVNKSVHLYIGGIYEDAGYKEKIEAAKDYITFLGWIGPLEKKQYLDQCGILVLPSYFEGFGVVIIEALFHKCAVIASAVGGIPEIIENGNDGILIPPRDSNALKQSIKLLMEDRGKAASMGEKGKKKVIENYSMENNIRKLMEIYHNILIQ